MEYKSEGIRQREQMTYHDHERPFDLWEEIKGEHLQHPSVLGWYEHEGETRKGEKKGGIGQYEL